MSTQRFIVAMDLGEPPPGYREKSPVENRDALRDLVQAMCSEEVKLTVEIVPDFTGGKTTLKLGPGGYREVIQENGGAK